MIIPFQALHADTLQVICEDWLTRQKQEWLGDAVERDEAINKVLLALKNKQLFITWDEEMNSLDIVDAEQLAQFQPTPDSDFEN